MRSVSPPYLVIRNISKLEFVLREVQKRETPHKLSFRVFSSWGLRSSTDRDFIHMLRHLGFLYLNNKPEPKYALLKDRSTYKYVIKDSLMEYYAAIFDIDIDAVSKDLTTLKGYFGRATGQGEKLISGMAQTFKELFVFVLGEVKNEETPYKTSPLQLKNSVNVTINLPATENIQIYEAIFQKLKDILH